MSIIQIVLLVLCFCCLVFSLFNRKSNVFFLLKEQCKIYYTYQKNGQDSRRFRLCWGDIMGFLICPFIISSALVWGFGFYFSENVSNIILTILSVIFSVLLTVLSVITAKLKNSDDVETKVSHEVFTTLSSSCAWLFLAIAVLLAHVILLGQVEVAPLFQSLTNVVLFILIHVGLLILMVLKRFYLVFRHETKN